MRAVLDTNILVDYLQGMERAKTEVAFYDQPGISLITWMEILTGAHSPEDDQLLRGFLSRFQIHPVAREVAEQAISLRRKHRLRLPDALIWATASVQEAIFGHAKHPRFPGTRPRHPHPLPDLMDIKESASGASRWPCTAG